MPDLLESADNNACFSFALTYMVAKLLVDKIMQEDHTDDDKRGALLSAIHGVHRDSLNILLRD
jgi:hypothetical protein